MSRQLGVEMTLLRPDDRKILMRGMILRRLRRTLTETQVGVGLGEDINEIRNKFSRFDFEEYVGKKFEPFLDDMIEDGLVVKSIKQAQKEGEKDEPEYGPGPKISEFDASLSDELEWFIDDLPMSTRGLFDNMLNSPTREAVVDIEEVIDEHNDGKRRIVEDSRDILNTRKNHMQDHGFRAGPTGTT